MSDHKKGDFDSSETTPLFGHKVKSSGAGSSDERTTPYNTTPLSGAMEEQKPRESLTDLLERYEILRELGRGGMGAVYLAQDRETGAEVALKVLLPEIAADPDNLRRFKSELLLARKVTHPNVCRVHELVRLGNTAAISMEYVEGESLRSLLKRARGLSVRHGTKVAEDILAGLRAAHEQGVIHRDLKPENIVITADGHAKIMDFGIAWSVEMGTTTLATSIIGTPAYLSPEQAKGGTADRRSDIYALGLVLYEVFAGEPAFKGPTTAAVLNMHVHEKAKPIRSVEPSVPAHVANAIEKCIEKEPNNRFQSVAELQTELFQTHGATPAPVRETVEHTEPLPEKLTSWEPSDYFLLSCGLLAGILIIFLSNLAFPFDTVRLLDEASAIQSIHTGLARIGVRAKIDRLSPNVNMESYAGLAASLGQEAARKLLLDGAASSCNAVLADGRGYWTVDQAGKPKSVRLSFRPMVFPQDPGPEEEAALVNRFLGSLFEEDLAGEALRKKQETIHGRSYSYRFPAGPADSYKEVSVDLGKNHFRVDTALGPSRTFEKSSWKPFWVNILAACVPAVLFSIRRLQKYPKPRVVILLYLLAVLSFLGFYRYSGPIPVFESVAMALLGDWVEYLYVGEFLSFLNLLFFAGIAALIYATLIACYYYVSRTDFTRIRTLVMVFGSGLLAGPSGLAVVRGALLGLIFSGTFVVLLALAARSGLAIPDLAWAKFLFDMDGFVLKSLCLGVLVALSVGGVLIAFPVSLARRASSKTPIIVAIVLVAWAVFGLNLAGTSAFPEPSDYCSTLLQAAFFCFVYLRWDLLTTMSALFSVHCWLIGYSQLVALGSGLLLAAWFAFVLVGLAMAFWSPLGAACRRVARVFQ